MYGLLGLTSKLWATNSLYYFMYSEGKTGADDFVCLVQGILAVFGEVW